MPAAPPSARSWPPRPPLQRHKLVRVQPHDGPPGAIDFRDSIHAEGSAHGVSDRLERISFRRRRIKHPIVANAYCQARVRIRPADRSAGARMADDVRIAADDRGRRGRFAAEVESTYTQVDDACEYLVDLAWIRARPTVEPAQRPGSTC